MIFSDIVALAKAGYSPADVREFLAATSEEAPKTTGDIEEGKEPEKPEIVEKSVENVDKQAEAKKEPETPEQAAGEDKYKSMYEQAVEDLKKAQAQNVRREINPDEKTPEDIFNAAALAFM